MTASMSQPAQTGIDLFMIANDGRRLDAVSAGVAEQDEDQTLKARNRARVIDERRDSDLGDEEADERAD